MKDSNKFSKVAKTLATLEPGEHSILGIVQKIKDIKNLKVDLDALADGSQFYADYGDTCNMRDLYVDITYQRKVRLQKLMNHLEELEGYDTAVAGTIDTIVRPNIGKSGKKFVWDGLRRTIMYGLCGGDIIRISPSTHPKGRSNEDCIKEEARLFKIRNADSEKMTPEEIFKSKVVYGDEIALDQFSILKKAGLDLEGLNPIGVTLGGFTLFDKCYQAALHLGYSKEFRKSIVDASNIIQKVWPKDDKVSLYVLCGLAYLVRLNDEYTDCYTIDEIVDAFLSWKLKVKDKTKPRKQSDITDVRLHGKAIFCIAYYIAKHIIKDPNGLVISIRQSLKDNGVKEDDFDFLDDSSNWDSGL